MTALREDMTADEYDGLDEVGCCGLFVGFSLAFLLLLFDDVITACLESLLRAGHVTGCSARGGKSAVVKGTTGLLMTFDGPTTSDCCGPDPPPPSGGASAKLLPDTVSVDEERLTARLGTPAAAAVRGPLLLRLPSGLGPLQGT